MYSVYVQSSSHLQFHLLLVELNPVSLHLPQFLCEVHVLLFCLPVATLYLTQLLCHHGEFAMQRGFVSLQLPLLHLKRGKGGGGGGGGGGEERERESGREGKQLVECRTRTLEAWVRIPFKAAQCSFCIIYCSAMDVCICLALCLPHIYTMHIVSALHSLTHACLPSSTYTCSLDIVPEW